MNLWASFSRPSFQAHLKKCFWRGGFNSLIKINMKNKISKKYIELLKEFLSFKSVSTDPDFKNECTKTSQWLSELFSKSGFDTVVDEGKNTNPLVIAKYVVDENAETIMIYGHYDVQPAKKEDGWQKDPFELDIRDGRFIARGAIDNKGQVLVHIFTVLDLIEKGNLKYNVTFLIEGDEESGNEDLVGQLEKHKEFLESDYVMISDGEIVKHFPTIESTFRGGANMTVKFQTAPNDFHSGIYGGAVPSASLTLVQTLAKLKDERNQVLVPEFYEGVNISGEQVKINESLASEEEILSLSGVKELLTKDGLDFYSQTGLLPTLEISGVVSGYTGVGYLNIVPAKAEARINVRTVPGQDTRVIMESIKSYILENSPTYTEIDFDMETPSDGVCLDTDSEKVCQIKEILSEVYGESVATKNVGGSIPIISDFKRLGMNVISISLANEDCNMHGVDENFEIDKLQKALDFSERFFQKIEIT